jgi:hypothetical protein
MNSAWVCLEHLFFAESSAGTFIKCEYSSLEPRCFL